MEPLRVRDDAGPDPSAGRLRVASTGPRFGVSIVRVSGEIDLVDASRLEYVLRSAVLDVASAAGRSGPEDVPRLVCDLDGVEFLGAAGLGVLASAVVSAHTHGVELVCFTVRRAVRQAIRLTALDQALSLIPSDVD